MSKQKQTNQTVTDKLDAYLQACLTNRYFMGSVLVAYRGEVLLNQGYGMANLEHGVHNSPQTKFRLGSITKQFTATAILQLQDQGLLDLQAPISTYLPNYPVGEQITIHQLLNHTSGIAEFTELENFEQTTKIEVALNDLIARFSHEPLEFLPGERYRYTNSGYIVLTKIIETVSGYSYKDYLQHCIFEPLEMMDSGCDSHEVILPHRASGYIFTGEIYQNADFVDMSWTLGAGGMYSTTEDLYKWEQSLDTNVILSQLSRETMFSPQVTIRESEDGKNFYHGYGGIICTHYEKKLLYHGGGINGFSTRIARYPDEQVSIMILTNIEASVVPAPVVWIANDLAAILFGEAYSLPKQRQAVKIDPAIYDAYVGQYDLEPGWTMNIIKDSDRLFAQWVGQERMELFAESSTQFFAKITDAPCTFVLDETGKAINLILQQGGRDRVAKRIN